MSKKLIKSCVYDLIPGMICLFLFFGCGGGGGGSGSGSSSSTVPGDTKSVQTYTMIVRYSPEDFGRSASASRSFNYFSVLISAAYAQEVQNGILILEEMDGNRKLGERSVDISRPIEETFSFEAAPGANIIAKLLMEKPASTGKTELAIHVRLEGVHKDTNITPEEVMKLSLIEKTGASPQNLSDDALARIDHKVGEKTRSEWLDAFNALERNEAPEEAEMKAVVEDIMYLALNENNRRLTCKTNNANVDAKAAANDELIFIRFDEASPFSITNESKNIKLTVGQTNQDDDLKHENVFYTELSIYSGPDVRITRLNPFPLPGQTKAALTGDFMYCSWELKSFNCDIRLTSISVNGPIYFNALLPLDGDGDGSSDTNMNIVCETDQKITLRGEPLVDTSIYEFVEPWVFDASEMFQGTYQR